MSLNVRPEEPAPADEDAVLESSCGSGLAQPAETSAATMLSMVIPMACLLLFIIAPRFARGGHLRTQALDNRTVGQYGHEALPRHYSS